MIATLTLHLLGFAVAAPTTGARPPVSPVCDSDPSASSTFEFASNPWLNLYNFLVKSAKHARGIEDDGLGARGYVSEDTAAVRPLTPTERREWDSAVEFFARAVVPDRMGIDSLVQRVNNVLAHASPNDTLDGTSLHPAIRRVLEDVMPLYRSAWWPVHDGRNRAWIGAIQTALIQRERCLVRRAESVFRAPWPATPIHVDASVYASWFGAYSTHPPARITVSANARGTQESYGVEVLLHEAGHSMLAPLDSALSVEAARRDKALPSELSHLVLFYTAGALVREQEPRYAGFAEEFGVWQRNALTREYHRIIAREWQPYLSGQRSFAEAIVGLVERIQ
jgi:hypothetical protein